MYRMKQHELEALKKLGVPVKRWGDDYRIKIRKDGRFVYVSNIHKTSYAKEIVKQNPKVFKTKNVNDGINKLKKVINNLKPRYKVWDKNPKKKTYLMEQYSTKEVYSKIEEILRSQKKIFKMRLSLGYTLINTETGEEKYWYPSDNTSVFESPIQINSKAEINTKIMDLLRDKDFSAGLKYPSSAWKLEKITAFSTTIYLINHRLGDEKIEIPKIIRDNKHVVNFPSTAKKCVFYCIAGFLNPEKDYRKIKMPVKNLFKDYCKFKGIEFTTPFYNSFEGVDLLQFDELEECFQININVFDMNLETGCVDIKRATTTTFEQTINILDYKGHAMLITKLDKFEGKHICSICEEIFSTARKLADHKKNKCAQKVLESFEAKPTVYTPSENSIKKLLRSYGIKSMDHYLDHFIVYDFESILKPINRGPSEDTVYVSEHIPVSVSICDSLTKQVQCFVSDDPKDLLIQMFDYIHKVQEKIYIYNAEKFETLFKQILLKIQPFDAKNLPDLSIADSISYDETMELIETGVFKSFADFLTAFSAKGDYERLYRNIHQVPLIGFNSGRYDISLIKKELFSVIGTGNIRSVIKNPNYMCLSTDKLKIIDISNYLPPGTNYDSYIKSYLGGCSCDDKIRCVCGMGKGLFPYEYITSFDKLNETELPPQSAFDSKFKNTTLSDADYERMKFVWSHYEMKSVKDLLVWYNNLDVEPFVKAIIEQRKFYKGFDLDMLHDGLSLPGLAEKIMYQISHSEMLPIKRQYGEPFHFPLSRFDGYRKQDKEAERQFTLTTEHVNEILSKQNFSCCYCCVALTEHNVSADRMNNKLGHVDGNVVVSCVECNVARKDMPMSAFRYKKKLEFNADRLVYSIDAENKEIYHKMKQNIAGGPSIIFTRYAEKGVTSIRGGKKQCQKVIGYDANALYLWALGNDMPCGRLTTIEPYEGLMDDIKSDRIFGFLECDIETPEHLKGYFSEMTPIFKNIDIDPTDRKLIGDHMADHNDSLGKRTKQRKLIGSYFGKKILVYTPLLKWYLDHGMVVTAIHSFIKAAKHQPFQMFANKVSEARREGDKDFSKAMIAEMMKLVGNAAFGRSGMDKSKHKEVKYASEDDIEKYVKKAQFSDFDVIQNNQINAYDNSYEISMDKRRIKLNNPIHLSIAIYQLAKLRMLQFYYDCIDYYFDRSDFQYIEMDTDSAYIAFSDEDPFKNLIKPQLHEHFEQHKFDWFPRNDTKEHAAFDRRTPGLFKEEWRGNGIYALAAKNYICFKPDEGHKIKISSKGVQGSNDTKNKRNSDILCPEAFKNVCENRVSLKATNKGFRVDKSTQRVITYEQLKTGLSYFYDKRRILDNGIDTAPLNI